MIVRGSYQDTFLCPRFRAGLCDLVNTIATDANNRVSMPSVSGWALRHTELLLASQINACFYALGFGRGFATLGLLTGGTLSFLCPRFRAGLCDVSGITGTQAELL
jgi:hypothetical protein